MTVPEILPPLRISLLNDVSGHSKLSKENSYDAKIAHALSYLHDFDFWRERSVDNGYTVQIYKSVPTLPSISKGFGGDEDEEEEEEEIQRPEYLAFIFYKTLQIPLVNSDVYVLSTSKAYKHIRDRCSYAFSKHCYAFYSDNLLKIDQVSRGQLFSATKESTLTLRGNLSERISQEEIVYHEVKAIFRSVPGIEGSDIKVEFNDRSVLIKRTLKLNEYARIIENLPPVITSNAVPNMPGLPSNSLIPVQDAQALNKLEECVALYAAGDSLPDGWTSNFELSERWCESGYKFRIHYYGGKKGSYPYDCTESYYATEALTKIQANGKWGFYAENILNKCIYLEYLSTDGLWYGQPLKDCFDGWIKTHCGQVYFKVDCAWYQIEDTHVAKIDTSLKSILEIPGVLLRQNNNGFLDIPWSSSVGENDYNKSYISRNQQSSARWFDGNQKFFSWLEIFDICKIDGNNVFIYHVKKDFDTELKKGGAQLLSSAQLIQSCRLKSEGNRDMIYLSEYCSRVGKQHAELLKQALLNKKLHFILAFRVEGDAKQKILSSGSMSAKHEIIKLKDQLSELNVGFGFCISPITKTS